MQLVVVVVLLVLIGLPALLLPTAVVDLLREALAGGSTARLVLAGGVIALAAWAGLRAAAWFRFFAAFQHETSHLIFALLMGGSPVGFRSWRGGGRLDYELGGAVTKARRFVIAIAPYWFSPLVLAPLVLIAILPRQSGLALVVLAATAVLALVLAVTQVDTRQPDLRLHGVTVSTLVALWLWAALVVVVLAVLEVGTLRVIPHLYSTAWSLSWHV